MVALSSSSSLLSPSSSFLGQKLAFNNTSAFPLHRATSVRFRPPSISATYTSTRPPSLYSSNMASSASLYEVLGITMGATFPEIKSAYRKLARVCHPDVVAIDRKDTSANEFKKIYAAYSTLSDPEKRAEYDRNLFSRQRIYRSSPSSASSYSSASSSMSGFSGSNRRTWETDQCW
ncbi:chaperone protein dnaJ 11, chloroplastic-like [Telopea speciosissima]|uniref:chaperone protein dnaJ 11, chloroplastic-like n=1 Tax=Telopea speciosissima TaxID=54955 RepID=UPI001CC7243A|nr:chaperone protein dnaJ 11, chloroplastic-like [Telopea speciosissima]